MVARQIRIGALEDAFQYDDADFDEAAETDQPIAIGTGTDPDHAARLDDIISNSTGSSTDNAIARWDGVTGQILQDSNVTINDAGSISLLAGETVDGVDISVHAATSSAHHARYTDAEARASINNIFGSDGKADSTIDMDFNSLTNVDDITASGTISSTESIVCNDLVRMTPEGGIAIKLENDTGANTVKGQLARASTSTDDAFELATASEEECIGVIYEDGIADGNDCWIVIGGIADVLFEDNHGTTRGYWVGSSTTDAGYAVTAAAVPAAPRHFEEIGHCIETVAAGGAGTNIYARCVLHFN